MKTRSFLCHEIADSIDGLTLVEMTLADPAPGEVQIEIKACAVNFPDILMIQGRYQFKPPMPFAPGGEFSGLVSKVGPGVLHLKAGDRVVAGTRFGGFSEHANVPVESVRVLPEHVSFAKAAGPKSITKSAARIVSSSCSTTITVLPISLIRQRVANNFSLSRWCKPILGSSSM